MLDKNRPELKEASFIQSIIRPGFLKFLTAFVIIILVAWLAYTYLANREDGDVAKYEEFLEITGAWQEKVAGDVYGGKTPRETLDMFIAALEAEDPALASRYFEIDERGGKEKWETIMKDTYDAGSFPLVLEALNSAEPDPDGIIGAVFYR